MMKKIFLLFFAIVFFNFASVEAGHVSCGQTIYTDTVLDSDLNCPEDGLTIGANDITLDCNGNAIVGPGWYNGKGITMMQKQNVEVKNCTIQSFYTGMSVSNSDSNIFSENTVRYNNRGFYISTSGNNVLIKNSVYSNGLGVRLHGSYNHTLIRNRVNSNVVYGIFVYGGYAGHTLIGNTANSNGRGIQLEFGGSNIVDGNTVMNNTWEGVLFYASSGNIIKNNFISQNHEKGIKIITNSNSNLIYNNYFNNTNNTFDDVGTNFWNISKIKEKNIVGGPITAGNFWYDYTGQDLNGDGIGDTNLPYNSNGNIQNGGDYYPLVERKMVSRV